MSRKEMYRASMWTLEAPSEGGSNGNKHFHFLVIDTGLNEEFRTFGSLLVERYGKEGSFGTINVRYFPSRDGALRSAEKKERQKLRGGYTAITSGPLRMREIDFEPSDPRPLRDFVGPAMWNTLLGKDLEKIGIGTDHQARAREMSERRERELAEKMERAAEARRMLEEQMRAEDERIQSTNETWGRF